MKNKFFKQRSFYAVFLSVVLSVVLVAGAAGAATTISSNINTGGTLTVSGVSSLNGNVNVGDATTGDNDLVYLYGTTTVIGAQAFVFGSSTGTTIEGQAAGSVYYDSTNRILRLFDGNNWYPVASSTDASGSLVIGNSNEGRVQFNDYSLAVLTLGTTTQALFLAETSSVADNGNGALLTLQATSTTNTPLRIIQGSTTQTANLFTILDASAGELFVIDGLGHASSTGSFTIAPDLGVGAASDALFVVGGYATTTASTGAFASAGGLTIAGASLLNGAVTLGDAVTDVITITGTATTSASFQVGINNEAGSDGDLSVSGMATTTGNTGDIATAGSISVGTTTVPASGIEATIDAFSTGTTTLRLSTTSTTAYSCIELSGPAGNFYLIATTSGTAYLELGTCSEGETGE